MRAPTTRDEGEQLFLDRLDTIEQVLRFACGRAFLSSADAEDFASYAKIRLIESDYAILRKFEARCSFTKYISIVLHRMLLDYRIHIWGKWHPSAEAKRLGAVAVRLEAILCRDRRTLQEALPLCQKLDPSLTLESLEVLASALPERQPKPRLVEIDSGIADRLSVSADSVYDDTVEAERVMLSQSVATVVRSAVETFPDDDRLLLRLHFGAGMTVVQIALVLETSQKPLYRRLKRILLELRRRLESKGITWAVVEEILAGRGGDLDFGLKKESQPARPSFSIGHIGETEDRIDSA